MDREFPEHLLGPGSQLPGNHIHFFSHVTVLLRAQYSAQV